MKLMLRKMALMGMSVAMLYTEDTYEIPQQPYFGYLRGRYTQQQLRELDRYAADLGIELIPLHPDPGASGAGAALAAE